MLWRPVTSWRCRAILLFVRSPCMCLPCLYTPELLASHVYSHLWEWFLIRYWKYQVTKWAIKTPKQNELYLVRKLGSLEEWWHSWRVWNESHPKLSITFVAYIQKMEADEQLRGLAGCKHIGLPVGLTYDQPFSQMLKKFRAQTVFICSNKVL